jgi:hypothetical protein
MKSTITFLVVLLMNTLLFAQGPNNRNDYNQYGSLIINAMTNKQFTVTIDNNNTYQSNNNNYNNSVNVGTLTSGYHSIEVYEWKTNIWGKQKKEIIYTGTINLKQNVATTISINAIGQASVNEIQLYNNTNNGNGKDGNNSYRRNKRNHCDNDGDNNNSDNDHFKKRKYKKNKHDD